jgi:hypothetical protein
MERTQTIKKLLLALCDQVLGSLQQIIIRFSGLSGGPEHTLGRPTFPRANQYSSSPDCRRRLQIPRRVANKRYTFHAKPIINAELLQQSWCRLAASALIIRPVRTKNNTVNFPAGTSDGYRHSSVNFVQSVFVEMTASKTRLIGRHSNGKTMVRQQRDCLRTAINCPPLVRGSNEGI